jgi:hypothetical protein
VAVTGATTTNGLTNAGNIATGTLGTTGNATVGGGLAVTGATTTNGLTNTGNIATATLGTTGNATVGGGLAVTGATTTNGIVNAGNIATTTLTTSGNATIGGNLTAASSTITAASLSSSGATTIGTNLTVGGNVAVAGNFNTPAGNITTTAGRIQAGTVTLNAGNSNRISGLANADLSATSTDAVTGQQLFATNALVDLTRFELRRTRNRAFQGVAMGFAANAAPLNLANGESGLAGGVGTFEGEWGGSLRAQVVSQGGIGFGANVVFSKDAVGGGLGASIKF